MLLHWRNKLGNLLVAGEQLVARKRLGFGKEPFPFYRAAIPWQGGTSSLTDDRPTAPGAVLNFSAKGGIGGKPFCVQKGFPPAARKPCNGENPLMPQRFPAKHPGARWVEQYNWFGIAFRGWVREGSFRLESCPSRRSPASLVTSPSRPPRVRLYRRTGRAGRWPRREGRCRRRRR